MITHWIFENADNAMARPTSQHTLRIWRTDEGWHWLVANKSYVITRSAGAEPNAEEAKLSAQVALKEHGGRK